MKEPRDHRVVTEGCYCIVVLKWWLRKAKPAEEADIMSRVFS